MQTLASMTWGQWMVSVLIIVICCFFMLVILLQRGRGGGLAGAFGGAGGSSAFGAKTGDVFTWITVVVAAVFLVVCVVANFVLEPPTDAELFAAQTSVAPSPETPSPPSGTLPVTLPVGTTDESSDVSPTDEGDAPSADSAEPTGDDTGGSDGDTEDPSIP